MLVTLICMHLEFCNICLQNFQHACKAEMLDERRRVIGFLISVLIYEYEFGAYSGVPAREVSRRSRADHVSKCDDISLIAQIKIFESTSILISGFEERIY